MILDNLTTLKVMRSAPKRQKINFDPPLDALGSEVSSAHQINIVRHTYDSMTAFLWKYGPDSNFHLKSIGGDPRFWWLRRLQKWPDQPQSVEN